MDKCLIVERVEPGTLSWEMYGGDHIQRYEFFASYGVGKVILDAACGSGYGSEILVQRGAKKVYGIDIDTDTIEKNKKTYPNDKITFHVLPCEEIDTLSESFDVIISFETIEHLKSPEVFFQKAQKMLKENGLFICSTPNTLRFGGSMYTSEKNKYHLHEMDYTTFKTLFQKYFIIQKIYHQSESIEFMRFLKVEHEINQLRAQIQSSLSYRFESLFRKIIRRPFQPIPFFYNKCHKQTEKDFIIEEISEGEAWHKTFILLGKPKK